MLKQICPHCLNPVTLPDDAAGKDATCPACKKAFPVQARYNPVVAATPTAPIPPAPLPPEPVPMSTVPPDRPAPPPGYVPPPSNTLEPTLPPTPPVPAPGAGYTHSRGITFSPRVIAWLPAVCLTLTLIATFFSWVGVYAGGYAVYSQGPWKALTGYSTVDQRLEATVRDKIPDQGKWRDTITSDWRLVFPYLLFLILATAFAWAERGVASLDHTRLPPYLRWVRTVWPYRVLVITVFATLGFILIVAQAANGFGLQRAAQQNVARKFAEARAAAGKSEAELMNIEFQEEQELAKYNLEKTSFYYLGLGLHLLAVLAIIGKVGLDARGVKPPPRVGLQY